MKVFLISTFNFHVLPRRRGIVSTVANEEYKGEDMHAILEAYNTLYTWNIQT